ncbi:multi protein-bridging factor 1 [Blastocladiella britannica]|nr:multi protein-bridging factor 1 [Blastocladiella britannica]
MSFAPTGSNLDWDAEIVLRRAPQKKSATDAPRTTASGLPMGLPRPGSAALKGGPRPGVANAKGGYDHRHASKVDREDEQFHVKHVSLDVGRAIQKARQDKAMSQKDLGTKINEKQTIIADYEQGKAQPNQQVLAKLERALGVKLRGQNIGEPLAPRGASASASSASAAGPSSAAARR